MRPGKTNTVNYKKYISEIKKLEMKPVKSFPDLSHFYVIKNRAPEEMEKLMNDALTDFASLPLTDVKRELTVVKHLEKAFSELDTQYPGLFQKFKNGNLGMQDLKLRLEPLFGFIRPDPEIITEKFMVGLYISILNKQNSILTFKNKIQNLMLARPLFLSQWGSCNG